MRILVKAALGAGLVGLMTAPAQAQIVVAADSGDTGWVLAAAIAGFAALLGGARLRMRDDLPWAPLAATAAIFWAVIGYSLAFGGGSTLIGGLDNVLLANLADIREGATIPDAAYVLLQFAFLAGAVTALIAAVADRARTAWAVVFALLWSLLAYSPVAHWVWGGGWLSGLGTLDYAGALVVHTLAGVSALVAAWMIGARTGAAASVSPHATGLIAAGWLTLTGAAGLSAGGDAAIALVNTILAAATGVAGWAALAALRRVPLGSGAAGALAGIAAVSASAGFTGTLGALVVGFAGGLIASAASGLIGRGGRLDEPAGVFAVTGVAGITGALLLPLLMLPLFGAPVFEDAAPFAQQVVAQLVAVAAIAIWAVLATLIAGYMAAMAFPMRKDEVKAG